MRYLGIDYGLKRIGLAFSDDEGKIAFPSKVLDAEDDPIGSISRLVQSEGVGAIVVGFPPPLPGTDSKLQGTIQDFSRELGNRCGILVYQENEMLTTKIAERHSGERADASAAALILQSFLDHKK